MATTTAGRLAASLCGSRSWPCRSWHLSSSNSDKRVPWLIWGFFVDALSSVSVLTMIGYGASAQVMVFFLPIFLQNAYGFEPMLAGFAMLPFAMPLVLAPRITSGLATRFSGRALLTSGLLLNVRCKRHVLTDGARAVPVSDLCTCSDRCLRIRVSCSTPQVHRLSHMRFAAASLVAAIVCLVAAGLTLVLISPVDTAPSSPLEKRPCKFIDCRDPL